MKKAVVTGGAGFAGFSLVENLLLNGYRVLCPVRPGSLHNSRLEALKTETNKTGQGELFLLSLDMERILSLKTETGKMDLDMSGCLFYHLTWKGGRDDTEQYDNIAPALDAVRAAKDIGASRILITGSQAEYGFKAGGERLPDGSVRRVDEDCLPEPVNSYGAAKTAAMYLTRDLCRHMGIGWNWLRIFSLYGKYEHKHTMLSYLAESLKNKEKPSLSSCTQYWDYLHVSDAAKAMTAVGERGSEGEIYNIANGDFKPLREFVEIFKKGIDPDSEIEYAPPCPENELLSLCPSVEKLKQDTFWEPERSFGYDPSEYISAEEP